MRRVVGIDPGLAGGVAVLDLDEQLEVQQVLLWRTPVVKVHRGRAKRREYDVGAMRAFLETYRAPNPHVAIELQGARPGQGVVSMFRTGLGLGIWWGLVVGLGFSYSIIPPGLWKRHHRLAGMDKAASRFRAQELLPQWGPIRACEEGCAEAALLALYAAQTILAPPLRKESWNG